MVMASTQPRCGSVVTKAASCPGSRQQDGGLIHNHHSPLAEAWTLGPTASPLMESGSSPTLCLRSGSGMRPGRVQLGYSSWEAGLAPAQSCFQPAMTLLLKASVCHMIPGNIYISYGKLKGVVVVSLVLESSSVLVPETEPPPPMISIPAGFVIFLLSPKSIWSV